MKTAEHITLVEHWAFGPAGDRCTLTVKDTGEVLRQEQWPHGESPAALTNPIRPASDELVFAKRLLYAPPGAVARLRHP